MRECQTYYAELQMRLDRHFSHSTHTISLNTILVNALNLKETPRHLDSQKDGNIQLADFVAGAILQRFTRKGVLADILDKRVVSGKIVKWKTSAQKMKR